MNPADWVLLAIVGAGALLGLRRGLVGGILDLAALAAGLGAALLVLPWLDDRLIGLGIDHRGLLFAAGGVVVGAVSLLLATVLKLVALPLGAARKVPPFGLFDSLLGIAPGIAKGVLAATAVALLLLLQFPASTVGAGVRDSRIGETLASVGSRGVEFAASQVDGDLRGLTATDVRPGQVAAAGALPLSGDLDGDAAAETEAFRLVNAARVEAGLPELERDRDLTPIARDHAESAAESAAGRLSPPSADAADRLARADRPVLAVGAVVSAGDSIAEIVDALLRSPDHRRVLLSGTYLRAGFGVLTGAGGESVLVGVFTL